LEWRHFQYADGTTIDMPMALFAVAEALNGSAVTWMERVPDGRYRAGCSESR
jgi:hypothetical protein